MKTITCVAAMAAILLCGASSVNADLVLGLQFSDQSTSKTVNSGDTVNVDLILTANGTESGLLDQGLILGGGRVVRQSGPISFALGAVTNVAAQWDMFFDANPISSGPGLELAKFAGAALTPVLPSLGGLPPTTVLLASFQFVATGASGDVSTLVADLLDAPNSYTLTDDLIDIDTHPLLTFGSIDLTIAGTAAVPEPASMILASLTAAIAGGGHYLRRRKLRKSAE
jgi:hypothetical protein